MRRIGSAVRRLRGEGVCFCSGKEGRWEAWGVLLHRLLVLASWLGS